MQFRLTYEGPLRPSSNNTKRAEHKQELRKIFNPQLRRLWQETPHLNCMAYPLPGGYTYVNADFSKHRSMVDHLAHNRQMAAYRFVPLVTEELSLWCGIDILFLRYSPPGKVFNAGDIDNRIKTVMDALKRPTQLQDVGERYQNPAMDENPFYVLLDDDSLVAKLSVETDTLLEPIVGGIPDDSDARLVITVTLRPLVVMVGNLGFAG